MTETEIRQYFNDSAELIMLLTMKEYSKDMLREIVQSRPKQKQEFEDYLRRRLSVMKINTKSNFIFGFDTKQFDKNIITYLTSCLVLNKELKDNISLFENWGGYDSIIKGKKVFKIC